MKVFFHISIHNEIINYLIIFTGKYSQIKDVYIINKMIFKFGQHNHYFPKSGNTVKVAYQIDLQEAQKQIIEYIFQEKFKKYDKCTFEFIIP